ncbi:alpha/beta fold hydrolase [Rhizobium sp. RCC_161_2]|uniref:alpha/beta fold hydrolase n=1 Tax=Rhizobium sp. RCC_161_2 TaxID=3239219 RepID=UPI00352595ED
MAGDIELLSDVLGIHTPLDRGGQRYRHNVLGGEASFFPSIAAEMVVGEFVEHGETASVPRCGHWIPEENPKALVEHILRFTGYS